VQHNLGINIKKWQGAKQCIKVYRLFGSYEKKPIHYNQYFALAKVGEVEHDLIAVAYQLDWNWVKATPKDIVKAVQNQLAPSEESDHSDTMELDTVEAFKEEEKQDETVECPLP